MATASTKSRNRKNADRSLTAPPAAATDAITNPATTHDSTEAVWGEELARPLWWLLCAIVLLAATALRVYALALKPMHHDEGVNGFFLVNLLRSGVYRYDPANYHGPTLYYFALPFAALADHFQILNTSVIRFVPALCGVLAVWLALALRRHLGMLGALAAAALLACSPGAVFLSRYFIHEMMFVGFTLGLVVAVVRYYDAETPVVRLEGDVPSNAWAGKATAVAPLFLVAGALAAVYYPAYYSYGLALMLGGLVATVAALLAYDGGRAVYLLLAALCAALLFATKETAFISAAVLILATLLAWLYAGFVRGREQARRTAQDRSRGGKRAAQRRDAREVKPWDELAAVWRNPTRRAPVLLVAAVGLFVFINLVFYSSFFTHAQGVADAFHAFNIWSKTGQSEFHRKPFATYVSWLWQEESPLVMLGVVGTLFALLRTRALNRFAIFAALWAGGIGVAYSLVRYKTPWLALNLVLPLALVSGYAVQSLWRAGTRRSFGSAPWLRPLALALLGASLALNLYQTYQLNLVHYDDDSYPYVYAHTRREFDQLMREVDRLAARAGTGGQTAVNVLSPDYWPMPWYLRDYKHVGYPGRVVPTSDPIVIANVTQEAELLPLLGANYARVGGLYALRPGVNLVLYARRDLAASAGY